MPSTEQNIPKLVNKPMDFVSLKSNSHSNMTSYENYQINWLKILKKKPTDNRTKYIYTQY